MNGDLISRSALLEQECFMDDDNGFRCSVVLSADVRRAPAADAGQKWISVEERLPDSQADVLVVAFWHECWQTMIGWHSDNGKKWRVLTPHGEQEPGGVTHWMPMPEPPKEG